MANENVDPEVLIDVEEVEDTPDLSLSVDNAEDTPADPEITLAVEVPDYVSEYNAEAWAVGERGGDPVGSSDPAYHNNAKYYAEQCTDVATGLASKADKTGTVLDTTLTVNGATVTGSDMRYLSEAAAKNDVDYPLEDLRRKIMAIKNVTRCRIYANTTNATDANGIPAKSISAVVTGGTTATIATVIAASLPGGYRTYGSASSTVYGRNVYVQRGHTDAISCTIGLTAQEGMISAAMITAIKESVVDYLNGIGLGEKVSIFGLSRAIHAVHGSDEVPFWIDSLSITTDGTTYTEDYQLGWYDRAMSQTGMIVVNVTEI